MALIQKLAWEMPMNDKENEYHTINNTIDFFKTRGKPREAWPLIKKDRERHGTGDEDEKFCKWNTNFHLEVSGKTGLPFPFPGIFQWDEPKSRVPFTSQPDFPESFGKWKTP